MTCFTVLLLSSCGKDAGSKPPIPEQDNAAAAKVAVNNERSGGGAAANGNSAQATLIDKGDTPRSFLRYRLKQGQTAVLTIENEESATIEERANNTSGVRSQTNRMVLEIEVRDVPPDGTAKGRFRLAACDVVRESGRSEGPLVSPIKNLRAMVGTAGRFSLDPFGHAKVTADEADQAAPTTRAALAYLTIAIQGLFTPLPAQEVGPNAEWKFSEPLDFGSWKLTHMIRVKVVSITADAVALKIDHNYHAWSQAVDVSALKLGQRAFINSFNTSSQQNLKLDLGLSAYASKTVSNGKMSLSVGETDRESDAAISISETITARMAKP